MKTPGRGKTIAILAALAGFAILALAGLYWKEARAWYVLVTEFERLSSNDRGQPEYRHTPSGIVFVLDDAVEGRTPVGGPGGKPAAEEVRR